MAAARRTAPGVRAEPSEPDGRPPSRCSAPTPSSTRSAATGSAGPAGAHLPVTILEGGGVVGPLVVPGATPCLGCVEQHHTDRDPDWPVLLAQLTADVPQRPTRLT